MHSNNHHTCCHRVLQLLIDSKRKGLRFNLQNDSTRTPEWAPPGFLPVYDLRGPISQQKGGDSGDRRLRELRNDFGIPIKKIFYQWGTNPKRHTWLYGLGCDPEQIDLENRCLKNIRIDSKTGQVGLVLS